MKPLVTKKNNFYPYLLLLIQPIFMASNIIVARGGVEYVPPVSLAFWRWLTVFIILMPFFFNEIIKKKEQFKKESFKDFKYLSIFALVCFQGFLGWFMVKSGLINNTDVSHYRLASHLGLALIVLSIIFWFILENLKIKKFITKINKSFLTTFLFIIFIQIICKP